MTDHEIEKSDLSIEVQSSGTITVEDETRKHCNLQHEEDDEGTEDSIDVESLSKSS